MCRQRPKFSVNNEFQVRCTDNIESVGRKRRDFSADKNFADDEMELGSGVEDGQMIGLNVPGPVTIASTSPDDPTDDPTETSDEEATDDATSEGFIVVSENPTIRPTTEKTSTTTTASTRVTTTEATTTTTTVTPSTEQITTTETSAQPPVPIQTTMIPPRDTIIKTPTDYPARWGNSYEPVPHLSNNPPPRKAEEYVPLVVPSDTPLTYSLLVSPNPEDYLAEDRAQGSAHVGIAPKTGN